MSIALGMVLVAVAATPAFAQTGSGMAPKKPSVAVEVVWSCEAMMEQAEDEKMSDRAPSLVELTAGVEQGETFLSCERSCTRDQVPCLYDGPNRAMQSEQLVRQPDICSGGLGIVAGAPNACFAFPSCRVIEAECSAVDDACEAVGAFWCDEFGKLKPLTGVQIIACEECPELLCPPLCTVSADVIAALEGSGSSTGAAVALSGLQRSEMPSVPAACLFNDTCLTRPDSVRLEATPVLIIELQPKPFFGLDPCLFDDTCQFEEDPTGLVVVELDEADFERLLILTPES